MYIGNLNHLVRFSISNVTVTEQGTVPAMMRSGNPLQGESLYVGWREKVNSNMDIRLPFTQRVFVDRLRLTLPKGLRLTAVCLYSGEKDQLLRRYTPETDHLLGGQQITLEANYETDLLILSMEGDFSSAGLENLEILGSCGHDGLYPTPVRADISADRISISRFGSCSGDCPEGVQAASILVRKLGAEGIFLPLSEKGGVRFCRDETTPENGFELQITAAEALIRASDLRGFVYGAETFMKLLQNGSVPLCKISDAPRMQFRGVHLFLPAREDIPFFKRLVEHILSPMGYNCIFLEFCGGMEFESHPEISAAYVHAVEQGKSGKWPHFPHGQVAGGKTLTKQEVAELVSFTRSFGIDVIPEVQSLGHVQYITVAHPEIAEIESQDPQEDTEVDIQEEDERPKRFYHHCCCPSNPETYRILFDLLDEIIEVVQPKKYVHMGHDEVYEIGVCPVCRQSTPAKLLAEDICRIHDYLAQKGFTMMMWADMLQPVTKYETYAAIDMIPKDIIMLDFIWYFHMDQDIEDNLLQKGFKVILGNMYSSHFPRYERRILKPGILGAQTSAWVCTNAEDMAREGKLYELLFSAQMLWSASYTSDHRYSYDWMLKAMIPKLRARLLDCAYPSQQEGAARFLLADQPDGDTTQFPVDHCCDSIVFCHNARKKRYKEPWKPAEEVGQYLVEYEDGMRVSVPITYGGTVGYYARRQNEPFSHSSYRHNGYTTTFMVDSEESRAADGSDICVYCHEWVNPRPEKVIRRITLTQPEGCPAGIAVHRICGIRV